MKMTKTQRRKAVQKEREKLTDREVFLSSPYHQSLSKLMKVLGQKKDIALNIGYDERPEGEIAFTDGRLIFLNAANRISMQYESRELKVLSHEGLVAHECGHIRFTDFGRRKIYLDGFLQGLIYPEPPKVKTAADKKAWEELKGVLLSKERTALLFLQNTAQYFRNLLEDVYIESRMCQEYPGSVRSAIQKNASFLLAEIPTEKERKENHAGDLSILMDLIFRYARAGRRTEENGYSRKYIRCLDRCRRIIDDCVQDSSPDSRLIATNQLLIKLWRYIKPEMEKCRNEMAGLSEEEMQKKVQEPGKNGCQWILLSSHQEASEGESAESYGWNGDPDSRDNTDQGSSGKRESEETRKGDTVQKMREELQEGTENEADASGKGTDQNGQQDIFDMAEELSRLQNHLSEAKVNCQEEKKLKANLKKKIERLEFNDIHKGVKIELHRDVDLPDEAGNEYAEIAPEIQKVSMRLQRIVEEILIRNEGGKLSGLYLGKRLDRNHMYRRDGKIFEKRIAPEQGLPIAVMILADNSESMDVDDRILYCRNACLVLYDFCRKLGIPVAVYGHSTHYPSGFAGSEIVDICIYADYDSVDGKDHFRIFKMDSISCNRDGAALQFAGERLLEREEEIKLLITISDGCPRANQYYGEVAKQDIQSIKRNLERKGVKLFAAAIGDDRKQIEEIYEDGFLNISDLQKMPDKLAKLLTGYIR